MKCYNHDVEAVGVCKHCQRGVCKECSTDMGHGLACKGMHEEDVEAINSLIDNNKKAFSSGPKATLFGPAFNVFMGILFMYYGYGKGVMSLPFLLGAGFLVLGVATYIYNTAYFKKVRTEYET